MQYILIYDTEAEKIDKVCEENNIAPAELIEMLMEFIDDAKVYNRLQ